MVVVMDDEQRYRAVRSRDSRFDGVFYTAVRTTGIYCRPSCPAVTPRRENVRFYRTAAAAQESGFRACKRCRPDTVPGSPEWNVRADVVGRAIRLIHDGAVDRGGVGALAENVGYSERQLNRLLTAEVGAGPLALARAERTHTARVLVETTDMPMADVAFASGFSSVRQFNETMRAVFDRSPSQMRATTRRAAPTPGGIVLRLPYRGPIDLEGMLSFLGARAVPGVEGFDGSYRRTLRLPHGPGVVELSAGSDHVLCRLWLTDPSDLTSAVRRCRSLLDLDADPDAVAEVLGPDPVLGPVLRQRPGTRAPGHVDPAELAVRAVLGQQVSVKAARTLAGRLVSRYGEPLPSGLGDLFPELTHTFASPDSLAGADPTGMSIPVSRGRALTTMAGAIASGRVDLGPGCDRDEAQRQLMELPGIGPWTAGYVRMRGLGDPDVFLSTDLGVRQALKQEAEPEAWSPWRSYATHLLWASLSLKESA
ncbi:MULTISPECIES: AlkA N-terminal domain-containing protein [unclassified Nocardiopsis]|uniref:AlkA N-terminal domain-containing protein n=1 Tax=unclassified Nocardiopsis TaxID=2649073 RepID=UPI00066E7A2C|nr:MULTISPECIES: AlkA N-terminal domain-containing protein [unclassified Nocardiopsis]